MSMIDTSDAPSRATAIDHSSEHDEMGHDSAHPDVFILSTEVKREMRGSNESLGTLGRPLDRRSPFFFGLTGALGVGVAFLIAYRKEFRKARRV